MAQRSNGATVKGVIDDLQRIVDGVKLLAVKDSTLGNDNESEVEEGDDECSLTGLTRPPQDDAIEDKDRKSWLETAPLKKLSEEEERSSESLPLLQCSMLAQWARVDSYYKVVITKYQGISVVIRAMKAFANSEEVQASCCVTLANLPNKVQVFQEGGVEAILNAMKRHPSSISVQSAALEALSGIMPLIQHLEENNDDTLHEIRTLVQRTEDMYLTENGKKAAMDVLQMMEK